MKKKYIIFHRLPNSIGTGDDNRPHYVAFYKEDFEKMQTMRPIEQQMLLSQKRYKTITKKS